MRKRLEAKGFQHYLYCRGSPQSCLGAVPDGKELPCRFLKISGSAGGKVRSANNVTAVSGIAGGKTDVAGTLASISSIVGVKTNIAGTLAGNSGMAGGKTDVASIEVTVSDLVTEVRSELRRDSDIFAVHALQAGCLPWIEL